MNLSERITTYSGISDKWKQPGAEMTKIKKVCAERESRTLLHIAMVAA